MPESFTFVQEDYSHSPAVSRCATAAKGEYVKYAKSRSRESESPGSEQPIDPLNAEAP
jgi:hypothetical protein